MSKIKFKNNAKKELEKGIKDTSNKLEEQREQTECLESEIKELDLIIQNKEHLVNDFESGAVKMDVNKFLNTKSEITALKEQRSIKIKDLESLNKTFDNLDSVLIDRLFFEHKDNLVSEFRENRYNAINEIFCLLMQINDISKELLEESKECYSLLQSTGHPKAHNYSFDVAMAQIWNRFIFNGFGCQYSQARTSDILEFEEKYFNEK